MAPRAVTSTGRGHRGGAGHPRPRHPARAGMGVRAGRVLLPQTMRHETIVLLRPLCHLWAEPAEDSEDEEEEEEEEVENKDPPKKLKKKLPKEAASGESREKKLKPKGE